METIKKRRVKVSNKYYASGYGRKINTRNVYEIDGKHYAYHPHYARQGHSPLIGEFEGYIEVSLISKYWFAF